MTEVEYEPPVEGGELVPPQDMAAERAVLGAAMLDREALADMVGILHPEDFYRPAHERIWVAMVALLNRDEPVDQMTVSDELSRVGDLGRTGGSAYLFEVVSACATAASGPYYADIVADRAVRRRLARAGTRITTLAYDGLGEAPDVVQAAHSEMDKVQVRRRNLTSHEQDLYTALEALEKGSESTLPTPWSGLTQVIGGWRPGNLYYVGARPGLGKTVVGICSAVDVARRHKRALICSLEMSKTEIYHRMLSAAGSVDSMKIMHRKITDADWKGGLGMAAASLQPLDLKVDDDPGQRVTDIRSRARAEARDGKLGIVVIDYLQLMSSGQRNPESRQAEVADMSRNLKLMARELNVPVLALSQLNRQAEARHDKRPRMSDFRESGSLEQDADVVILLHRDDDHPDVIEFLVEKNRHGPSNITVSLRWEGQYSRVTEPRWSPSARAV